MNEEKFTGKADIYAKYRPAYPDTFLDYLYTDIGFSAQSTIADIGAGTGILSKLLLQRHSRVICVEPNDDMMSMMKNALADFSKVRLVQASAEHTGLEDDCVDFVTVAQAFHWFDSTLFKTECQRILRLPARGKSGKVVLVWNNKDMDSPVMQEIAEAHARYREGGAAVSAARKTSADGYADFFRNGRCVCKEFQNNFTQDEEALIGGCLSASDAPKDGTANYRDFVRELQRIFRLYSENGLLTVRQVTRSYVGDV